MQTIKRYVPMPLKKVYRRAWQWWFEHVIYPRQHKDVLIPPFNLIRIGGGDFIAIGEEFVRLFIEYAHLKPQETVLDVGCGVGRMAIPLTRYLSKEGRYEGFDIDPEMIEWCQKILTPRFPNFHFQVADVHSEVYNPQGKYKASEYRFPYPDNSFDFIYLTSVFTHMLPADIERYLAEITRVMKPDGRCLITYFLLNPESSGLIEAGKSALDFKYRVSECLTTHPDNPEEALAYEDEKIRQRHAAAGLHICEPVYYGAWCGRSQYLSYQDIVLSTKA